MPTPNGSRTERNCTCRALLPSDRGLVTSEPSATLLALPSILGETRHRNGRHEHTARNRVHLSHVWRGRRRRHRRQLPLRSARHRSDDHGRPPGRGTDRHRHGGLTALDGDESPVAHNQRRRLAQVRRRETLAEKLMSVEWVAAARTHELPVRCERQRCRPGRGWSGTGRENPHPGGIVP
jgi:hypothetical protein